MRQQASRTHNTAVFHITTQREQRGEGRREGEREEKRKRRERIRGERKRGEKRNIAVADCLADCLLFKGRLEDHWYVCVCACVLVRVSNKLARPIVN